MLRYLFIVSSLFLWGQLAESAQDEPRSVNAVALFNGKAMLAIDGGRAKIIKVGETYKGVKLIAADTKQASIELAGQIEVLTLNSTVRLSAGLGAAPVAANDQLQLWADGQGFFRSEGAINGRNVEFLVDTGATIVVLSSAHANRIGLSFQDGARAMASTASGTAPMYIIEATEVSLGGIRLDSIEIGIIEGKYPQIPLLGMSFLERVDMNRSGNMMVLKKRY